MPEASADPTHGSIGVLICDDVVEMRELLAALVEMRVGLYVAGEAADGIEAITEAQRLQPDVILLDLSMPRMTGLDALPEIRKVAPQAMVVVLSGFTASVVAADVLARGAHRYIEKGVAPRVIGDAIEEVMASRMVEPNV